MLGDTVMGANNKKQTTEQFIEKSKSIYGDIFLYDKTVYGNINSKVIVTCKIHGDFLQRANDHLSGKGCIKCAISDKMSKAVKDIRNVLDMKNVSYEMEKTFDDCKNILPLRFDFYLPTFNMCNEYDGLQHFESCGWGGEEKLKLTQKNDKIKNDYCIQNNIKLLRIKYDEDHIRIVLENIS